jgi:hypothetical protein
VLQKIQKQFKKPKQNRFRETSMETHIRQQELPDVSAEQRASNEMVKLIRKLRWMGMEGEARLLQISLDGRRQVDSVVAEPRETD